jgi:predicted secreted protein
MDALTFDAQTGQLLEPARLLLPGGRTEHIDMVAGATVRELLSGLPDDMQSMLSVYNHGTAIKDWDGFRLRAGDRILITLTPQGGRGGAKQIVGAILMIVVSIYAPGAGAAIAEGIGASAAVGTAIGVGITMVAGMVISALIAPAPISTANPSAIGVSGPQSYSLAGQSNQPRPYNACFVIYGQHKVMPPIANNPDVDNWGSSSTLSALYDFGLGYVNLYDIRIGDVPWDQYTPQSVFHQYSYCNDLRLNASRIGYDQYALNLQSMVPVTVRTKLDTICANMDFQFPKGIFQAAPAFGQIAFWADFTAYWRRVGDTAWNEVPLDWYYGANQGRYYTTEQVGIQYALLDGNQWTTYNPSTSPADLRKQSADWAAAQPVNPNVDALYCAATPNPNVLAFGYPSGNIDEASYFARYPEIRNAGWSRTAKDHFESIGSREGRDPGVPATYTTSNGTVPYDPSTSPSSLHAFDKQTRPFDQNSGGWYWIDTHARLDPAAIPHAQFMWQRTAEAWDPNVYLARYPDVAAGGMDPWEHFTKYGAFEGRDPYVTQVTRAVRLQACWVGPYWMRIFFQFPTPGEYELQVMRTDKICDGTDNSIIQTSKGGITGQYNESVLALLRSYQPGLAVQPRLRHSMLEMQVTATDKLTGVVQNLSAIAVSVLQVTNDGANFWWAETRNPAWIALDILTSEKNPKPLALSQIDWPSWLHLAAACDTVRYWVANGMPYAGPRYTCDIVVDTTMTVKDLIESVLAGCRASMVLTAGGTWGVLLDEEKTVPRQLITPANSWGFSGVRTFTPYPHALRVNFINRDNGWQKDEVVVYWDGYSEANATVFETLDTFGITDYPHAWANGRYMLAQGIERSEIFTLSMDVENLLVQRGDLVYVAHDVPKVGGVPARVVEVYVDPHAPWGAVHLSHPFSATPSGYAVRLSDGTVRTGPASPASQGPDWIALDNITGIEPDDLIVMGDFTRETQPYLVQRITPGADLSAELSLCRYSAAVYGADIGALPPWDPGFGHDYLNGTDLVSSNMKVTQALYYVAREPKVDVVLGWTTTGWSLHHHEVTVITPAGMRTSLDGVHVPANLTWTVDALRERQYFNVSLQFEVIPISALGARGKPAYGSIVLLLDTTPPRPVIQFGANVQKENVDLFWQTADDPDIAYFMLRYTPEANYPDWNSSQVLANLQWPTNKTSAGARTGSYGIRVVDTSGNISDVVWRRTTVAFLPEINVITVLNDRDLDPQWPGQKSHVIHVGAEIESEGDFGAVYPDGIYYCSYPVDLGDVYEVRVSSKLEAYGVTAAEYMASWPTLASVDSLAHANTALWDAWLEVRTADAMKMMVDWVPSISTVNPIATGDDNAWSAWRSCQVGDFTAQILQFRIVLQSKNPGVRVVVSSGRIEVDMPDRIDTYGDVSVPAAGIDFVYPVAFRKVEAIAITIDGNANPVVAVVSNKTAEGFHLVLKNTQTSAATAGQVDIMAEGYGRKRALSI